MLTRVLLRPQIFTDLLIVCELVPLMGEEKNRLAGGTPFLKKNVIIA